MRFFILNVSLPKGWKAFFTAAALICLALSLLTGVAARAGQVPQNFTFQGAIPTLPDGVYQMDLSVTGGNSTLATTGNAVTVTGGVFTIAIQNNAGLTPEVFYGANPVANIAVNQNSTLMGQYNGIPLTPVASAFVAQEALSLVSTATITHNQIADQIPASMISGTLTAANIPVLTSSNISGPIAVGNGSAYNFTANNITLNGSGSLALTSANGKTFTLNPPTSPSANESWNLPASGGSSGQFLKTDGSGNLSWSSLSGVALITATTANISNIGASGIKSASVDVTGQLSAGTLNANGITNYYGIVNESGGITNTGGITSSGVLTNGGNISIGSNAVIFNSTAALNLNGAGMVIHMASAPSNGEALVYSTTGVWVNRTSLPCPTGMKGTLGISGTAFCIDTNTNSAATWTGAVESCRLAGKQLCSVEQWYTACNTAAPLTGLGYAEWTKDTTYVGSNLNAMTVGNAAGVASAACTITTAGNAAPSIISTGNTNSYRCCF